MTERAPSVPPVTDQLRQAARAQPGGWVYAVDPAYDPEGAVPPEGIVGAWRVDNRGEITGEFEPNPNYRPSPEALELPEPADPLDAVLQQAVTGRLGDEQVMAALLDAELWLYAREEPGFFSVPDEQGGQLIYAFSSQHHASASAPEVTRWQRVRGADLARAWPPGHDLYLNPGTRLAVRIPGSSLTAAGQRPQQDP